MRNISYILCDNSNSGDSCNFDKCVMNKSERMAMDYVSEVGKRSQKKLDADMVVEIYNAYLSGYNATHKGVKQLVPYNKIIDVVCKYYGIKYDFLIRKTRIHEVVLTRQICMYLGREFTDLSLSLLGEKFNRDHATAYYAYKTIRDLMTYDRKLRIEIQEITERL